MRSVQSRIVRNDLRFHSNTFGSSDRSDYRLCHLKYAKEMTQCRADSATRTQLHRPHRATSSALKHALGACRRVNEPLRVTSLLKTARHAPVVSDLHTCCSTAFKSWRLPVFSPNP